MPETFTIGEARYDVTLHRGSEGQRLALTLSALLVEPLATAVGPLLLGAVSGKRGLKGLLDDPTALDGLDLPAIGRAARASLVTLDDATIFAVLRYTNRNGQPLVHNGQPTGAYDSGYAGNYMELGQALWKVASINGFFPGLDTFTSVLPKAS